VPIVAWVLGSHPPKESAMYIGLGTLLIIIILVVLLT
jgi:hypothetical protein